MAQRGAGCAEYLSLCMNACVAKTAKADQDQLKPRMGKVLGWAGFNALSDPTMYLFKGFSIQDALSYGMLPNSRIYGL